MVVGPFLFESPMSHRWSMFRTASSRGSSLEDGTKFDQGGCLIPPRAETCSMQFPRRTAGAPPRRTPLRNQFLSRWRGAPRRVARRRSDESSSHYRPSGLVQMFQDMKVGDAAGQRSFRTELQRNQLNGPSLPFYEKFSKILPARSLKVTSYTLPES